jgi:16S rRNA (cytosine967-C5)-methyltransferase
MLALRIGAFQLLHMDRIPAHAALSESVELVRAAGHPKAAGLVNAVLRKLAARVAEAAERKPLFESTETMAARLGHPAWLVRRWVESYGREAARAICEHDQREPAAGELFAEPAATDAPEEPTSADRGLIMDDGSRLVAELAALTTADPRRIWDACAAPGGKAAVLTLRHAQAELLATDVSARRLAAMTARLNRELPGHKVRALQADAARLPEGEGEFDLVLCDVPCSGTGTLARNPEIRLRLRQEELARQAERQRMILAAAIDRLAVGGYLVYSTCSLEPEENERVVRDVLAGRRGVRLCEIAPLLTRLHESGRSRASEETLRGLARGEFLRTLPGVGFEGDGFFAAVLQRAG